MTHSFVIKMIFSLKCIQSSAEPAPPGYNPEPWKSLISFKLPNDFLKLHKISSSLPPVINLTDDDLKTDRKLTSPGETTSSKESIGMPSSELFYTAVIDVTPFFSPFHGRSLCNQFEDQMLKLSLEPDYFMVEMKCFDPETIVVNEVPQATVW